MRALALRRFGGVRPGCALRQLPRLGATRRGVSSGNGRDWAHSVVAHDGAGAYHADRRDGSALYAQRFEVCLPFHAPGLAPVTALTPTGADGSPRAYHISPNGEPLYPQRYQRTFGFYEERATVCASDGWHHITTTGAAAYPQRWEWAGNFQSARCPVRDASGAYFHVTDSGRVVSGPHAYAGDFREGAAVVRSAADGLCYHVDSDGCALPRAERLELFDLDVFHKGFARARDKGGWFWIDRAGREVGGAAARGRRYAAVESHYNSHALVTRLNGTRAVVDEQHRVMAELPASDTEERARLHEV